MTEEQLHKHICHYIKIQYPKVLFNTDLSGIRLTKGTAKKVKSLRSNKGFPDIVIYKKTKYYNALFLEVKKETPYKKHGKLKKNERLQQQQEVMKRLNREGYMALFVWNFETAKLIIDEHMKGTCFQT